MLQKFNTPTEVFEMYYDYIVKYGTEFNGCKSIFNVGFEILNPIDNIIKTPWRKFNHEYAEYEWQWYLSGNPDGTEIAKRAKIWQNMLDKNGHVQSNYGYQWNRNNQLQNVIDLLNKNNETRQAVITIYDGKEHENYSYDTPCTLNIQFFILENKLNMTVMMRSNDLVYGFCNDQYCFSNLQKIIAEKTNTEIGSYYHFTNNLHVYPRHYNLKE